MTFTTLLALCVLFASVSASGNYTLCSLTNTSFSLPLSGSGFIFGADFSLSGSYANALSCYATFSLPGFGPFDTVTLSCSYNTETCCDFVRTAGNAVVSYGSYSAAAAAMLAVTKYQGVGQFSNTYTRGVQAQFYTDGSVVRAGPGFTCAYMVADVNACLAFPCTDPLAVCTDLPNAPNSSIGRICQSSFCNNNGSAPIALKLGSGMLVNSVVDANGSYLPNQNCFVSFVLLGATATFRCAYNLDAASADVFALVGNRTANYPNFTAAYDDLFPAAVTGAGVLGPLTFEQGVQVLFATDATGGATGPGYQCNYTVTEIDACVAFPCDAGATCVDLPAPAPVSENGRTCARTICNINSPVVQPLTGKGFIYGSIMNGGVYLNNLGCWASFAIPAGFQVALSCSYNTEAALDYIGVNGNSQVGFGSLQNASAGIITSTPFSGQGGSFKRNFTDGVQFIFVTDGSVTYAGAGFTCAYSVTTADACELAPCGDVRATCRDLAAPAPKNVSGRLCTVDLCALNSAAPVPWTLGSGAVTVGGSANCWGSFVASGVAVTLTCTYNLAAGDLVAVYNSSSIFNNFSAALAGATAVGATVLGSGTIGPMQFLQGSRLVYAASDPTSSLQCSYVVADVDACAAFPCEGGAVCADLPSAPNTAAGRICSFTACSLSFNTIVALPSRGVIYGSALDVNGVYLNNLACWATFSVPSGLAANVSCSFATQVTNDYAIVAASNGLVSYSTFAAAALGFTGLATSSGTGTLQRTVEGGLQILFRTDSTVGVAGRGLTCAFNTFDVDACVANPCPVAQATCSDIKGGPNSPAGRVCSVNVCNVTTMVVLAPGNGTLLAVGQSRPARACFGAFQTTGLAVALTCTFNTSAVGDYAVISNSSASFANFSAAASGLALSTLLGAGIFTPDVSFLQRAQLLFLSNNSGSFLKCDYNGVEINACVNNPCEDPNAVCSDLPSPALDSADGRRCALTVCALNQTAAVVSPLAASRGIIYGSTLSATGSYLNSVACYATFSIAFGSVANFVCSYQTEVNYDYFVLVQTNGSVSYPTYAAANAVMSSLPRITGSGSISRAIVGGLQLLVVSDTSVTYAGNIFACSYVVSDINACAAFPCAPNANCADISGAGNTTDGRICACNTGFSDDGSGGCVDVDECTQASHNCDINADCSNIEGSFTCACAIGFTGDGLLCNDVNECALGSHSCAANATCTNIVGSFTCLCNEGFTGGGLVCGDVNECLGAPCRNGATCTNAVGSFDCACVPGFFGPLCDSNKNECASNPCVNGGTCIDRINQFECDCVKGFNTTTCATDVDECEQGIHSCAPGAALCSNNFGSFTCACKTGFTGNGVGCNDLDECGPLNLDNCFANSKCTNNYGSFTCACNAGWTGDGVGFCDDLNECGVLALNNCNANAKCSNTAGSFACSCNVGFSGDGLTCRDNDECSVTGLHNCNANADCSNAPGSFFCSCKVGYVGSGVVCSDKNECTLGAHTCQASVASCTNTAGSFSCACNAGYTGNGVVCSDTDECTAAVHNCGVGTGSCTNSVGSFACSCNAGYAGNGVTCNDVNECSIKLSNCPADSATCRNSVGSFTCACNGGYTGDGITCVDINECATSPCLNSATCANSAGSFSCACVAGFFGPLCASNFDECASSPCVNGGSCVDGINAFTCSCAAGWTGVFCKDNVDECAQNIHSCAPSTAACTDNAGSFTCACNAGYTGNGLGCSDFDECVLRLATCFADEKVVTCRNTFGSYSCTCNTGYFGDGQFQCNDVVECVVGTHNCPAGASTCTNTVGSFTCACNVGFQGNGVTCFDEQECATDTHNCPVAKASCTNTLGSFTCACNAGYTGSGVACSDVDECGLGLHSCADKASCSNTEGSFACTCNVGFAGSGQVCADANECDSVVHNCHADALCTNIVGSFTCACNVGFAGVGLSCMDIDECAAVNSCSAQALCVNTVGSFGCACVPGFTGDGGTCDDIDECTLRLDNCLSNGTRWCNNTAGSFFCTCSSRFAGRTCGTKAAASSSSTNSNLGLAVGVAIGGVGALLVIVLIVALVVLPRYRQSQHPIQTLNGAGTVRGVNPLFNPAGQSSDEFGQQPSAFGLSNPLYDGATAPSDHAGVLLAPGYMDISPDHDQYLHDDDNQTYADVPSFSGHENTDTES